MTDTAAKLKALERAAEVNRMRRELGIKPEHLDPIDKARRNPRSLRRN